MKILDYKFYYFLGIGGIGMSALARFFNHYKKKVVGYDKTPSSLTAQMQGEGIECFFDEDVERLKTLLENNSSNDVLVVYTPAVPNSNAELIFLQNKDYKILKRSVVLGEISKQFKTIAIAGTHGKTTTTTLVAHILKSSGINCFAFMGGISKNYNTNLLLGDINNTENYVVVEADEFDRSFLTLEPEIAVITSVDADHLDIYSNDGEVKKGYTLFANQVKSEGVLIVKKNVDNELSLLRKRLIYSLNLDTEYCAESIVIENAEISCNIKSPIENVRDVHIGIPGLHNVENSVAAVAIAQQLGLGAEQIRSALRSFSGVKRRFDYRVKNEKVIFIDDYAHHPEELNAIINSVKKLFPHKKITGIFQPHLFSRTQDFVDAFAKSLSELDECLLLEIYPAREKPIHGVNSNWLLNKINIKNKKVLGKDALIEELKSRKRELILTMGAGDIDLMLEPIEKMIAEYY